MGLKRSETKESTEEDQAKSAGRKLVMSNSITLAGALDLLMRTRGENLICDEMSSHETRKRLNEIEKKTTWKRDFYYCYFCLAVCMLLFPCIYISLLSACVAFFAFLNFPFVAIQWSEKKKGEKHFDITFLFRPHRQRCRILLVRSIANRLVDFLYIFSALLCSSSSPFPPLHLPRLRSDARTGGIWRVYLYG
jgi:hypothetical protein